MILDASNGLTIQSINFCGTIHNSPSKRCSLMLPYSSSSLAQAFTGSCEADFTEPVLPQSSYYCTLNSNCPAFSIVGNVNPYALPQYLPNQTGVPLKRPLSETYIDISNDVCSSPSQARKRPSVGTGLFDKYDPNLADASMSDRLFAGQVGPSSFYVCPVSLYATSNDAAPPLTVIYQETSIPGNILNTNNSIRRPLSDVTNSIRFEQIPTHTDIASKPSLIPVPFYDSEPLLNQYQPFDSYPNTNQTLPSNVEPFNIQDNSQQNLPLSDYFVSGYSSTTPDCSQTGIQYADLYPKPPGETKSKNEKKNIDEITKYLDCRYLSASEAAWRILSFDMFGRNPSVLRLPVHLENQQSILFREDGSIQQVLENQRNLKTPLTEFFQLNCCDTEATQYTYLQIPRHYVWDPSHKSWRKRKMKSQFGRIYTANPKEGERYFLRVLLLHRRGPTSFEDLKTVEGEICTSFKVACERLGLLKDDKAHHECLTEAATFKMPKELRHLFAMILIHEEPTFIGKLWENHLEAMAEDYLNLDINARTQAVLLDLQEILNSHNMSLSKFKQLPQLEMINLPTKRSLIEEMREQPVSLDDLSKIDRLNSEQCDAYQGILAQIYIGEAIIDSQPMESKNSQKKVGAFFIDGPAGSGKTFLYEAIIAKVRSKKDIVLVVASSGIAALLLPGGKTAHSLFKIPIPIGPDSMCNIRRNSFLAKLIQQTRLVVWDEAPMTHKHAIEAVDRTLRDICDQPNLPFGGKVFVFGGDFRQVLPVVPKGTRPQIVDASFRRSRLWEDVRIYRLRCNMRVKEDSGEYMSYLLRIGEGLEPSIGDGLVRLLDQWVIPYDSLDDLNKFIQSVFPDFSNYNQLAERAILAPRNEDIDEINDHIISLFPGKCHNFFSTDSVAENQHLYPPEFLNSLPLASLPPHKLQLKIGVPIMLLRNLDQKRGLCNGTRLICRGFSNNVIDAEILSGDHKGKRVFIPSLPLQPSEESQLPFMLTRRQFPVRLAFALTINKAQGQTIPYIGVYLPTQVFSHGQLYVALSRVRSKNNIKILLKNGRIEGYDGYYTKNVVYKEILQFP